MHIPRYLCLDLCVVLQIFGCMPLRIEAGIWQDHNRLHAKRDINQVQDGTSRSKE